MTQNDFTAIEIDNDWECSHCGKTISCLQMAMEEIKGEDIICPDCYDNL